MGSPLTHIQTPKTEVKETKNRKKVLAPKKPNTATCLRPLKQTKF